MTKRKRSREYTWYLYTKDAMTNEIFSREIPAENANSSVECKDGKTRQMWVCEYKHVDLFLKNKLAFKLKFQVFLKEGGSLPEPWKGWPKKKPTKMKKARELIA